MKNKNQLAEEYCNKIYQEAVKEEMYAPDVYQSEIDFIEGYNKAIERVKEYLFNTEEHTEQYKNDPNYISPEYLKQTIKFLNEQ